MKRKLTFKMDNFCLTYVKAGATFGNASASYRASYNCENMNAASVARKAQELMGHETVTARIAELRAEFVKDAKFSALEVLRHWVAIATADPNDIVQNRRTCCRFCYGIKHHKQWVEEEYALACAEAAMKGKPLPNADGGFGYNGTFRPHATCAMCFGEGVASVYVADTRDLKGGARLLYAGVRQKNGGIEVILRDQDAALTNLAKYFSMFEAGASDDDREPLIPISDVTSDPLEAQRIYVRMMK